MSAGSLGESCADQAGWGHRVAWWLGRMCGRRVSMAWSTSASLVEMWKDRRRRPARADPAMRAVAMAAAVPVSVARDTIAEFPGSRPAPVRNRLARPRACLCRDWVPTCARSLTAEPA